MADKDIQMRQRNADNTGWDNLNPMTKASLVKFENGTTVESHLNESATNAHAPKNVGLSNVQNYGIATQAEAEAGTSNAKYVTPLRAKQAITANAEAIRTANKPIRLEVVSSVGSLSPTAGRMVFDTTEGKAKVGNGSAWV